jgi:hypothetical protein
MKKVFISQPMRDLSDTEIKEERKAIKQTIIKEYGDVEFIDSYFEGAPANANPMWFLGKSLELLSMADMAFFAKDWESARGCRIEHITAEEYGIEIIHD